MKTVKTVNIPIADIQVDLSIQPRANGLNQEHADDLAEAYRRGDDVPPIRVYRIGTTYKLAQGFHRLEAAKRAEQADIDCEVVAGDEQACAIDALCSNQTHGLKRSQEDKRRCVARMLELVPDWSDRRIADSAGVGHQLVASVRPQEPQVDESSTCPKRTGKDGKTYTAKPKQPATKKPAPTATPETPTPTPLSGRTHPSANASDVQGGTEEYDEVDGGGEEEALPPLPPPKAAPLRDGTGRAVPPGLMDTFGDPELRETIADFQRARRELDERYQRVVRSLSRKPYSFCLFSVVTEKMSQVVNPKGGMIQACIDALIAGIPFTVCGCGGDSKCKRCRGGCGYLPEWRHKELNGGPG